MESAKSCFVEAEIRDLGCLIRITCEFLDYLETANPNPTSDFDLRYAIETIFSGVDSFSSVSAGYRALADPPPSTIHWGDVPASTFIEAFTSKFHEFAAESGFEKKCRLLLDLVKLQIIFAGFSYD